MTEHTVGYLIGSLSKESINRRLANALINLAPDNLVFTEIEIGDLPLYNRDLDANYPAPAQRLKEHLASVDAFLFVTPEYNRSIPGSLKTAIDWGSRPWGTNSFSRKPSAVIGASPGKLGTAVAQQTLRSILGFCDSPQMNAPEAYIEFTKGLVDDDGNVTVPETEEFLANWMARFGEFITRVRAVIPPGE
ncbi:NADPH-dependent FMN reductase [Nocardioides sp. AE5]|uniref:NADPH-dependent FMN reductase n=1 Tax=Nocardioides sp. AE5 TaxID=2962573 RepID=UPI0028827BE0|nr:NADPH-dependent FMN reductase [Nocardioides sp. AE5]MDT0203000.1 NADPH-dependent FMN reductase [Nocardioides sp. AE5]